MNRKCKLNEDYFRVLETPEQAYILGFIYADGYNREDTLELVQINSRIDVLYKIRDALSSDAELKEYTPGKSTIYFNSRTLCIDLSRLGATKAKSLTLEFPNFIPDELMSHFIRGYFDGDGCVWDGKRKTMTVKDLSKPCGFRERIVHNVKFTFTGNSKFITELQAYLMRKLGFKRTKLNFSKAKERKHICTMEYSGRGQLKALYDYMYKDADIYCEEKFNKFNTIFCASLEKSNVETTLTEETPEMVIVNQASNIEEGSSTIPEMGVESSDSKCVALNR